MNEEEIDRTIEAYLKIEGAAEKVAEARASIEYGPSSSLGKYAVNEYEIKWDVYDHELRKTGNVTVGFSEIYMQISDG